MKRNLLLFIVTVTLGIFTYFFQEVPQRAAFEEEKKKGVVLDPDALGELSGFELPRVGIEKQGAPFFITKSRHLVDSRKIDWFMNILSNIKIKRIISSKEWDESQRTSFFPNKTEKMIFKFKKGKVTFLLGKKLDFDQSFYMEVNDGKKTSRVIAFDDGQLESVYNKEDGHRNDHRYRRFRSLFYLNEGFFRDYRIFRHWNKKKKWSLLEVTIDGKTNRKFTLNFPKGETVPRSPFFLKADLKKFSEMERALVSLEGIGVMDKEASFYEEEPFSKMTLNSTEGEVRLSLFYKKGDKANIFLKSSLDNLIYKIDKKQADPFLKNLQTFWDLRPLKNDPESLKIAFNPNKEDFISINFKKEDHRFYAIAKGKEGNHNNFKGLINFLKKSADSWHFEVGLMDSFIPQFKLDWGYGPFYLGIRSGEIVLYHKEKYHALIYKIIGTPPIKMLKEEYIYE